MPGMTHAEQEAYGADVVYGTNNEFGFDYLRDNMAFTLAEKMQSELSFAIVDEVDSILIDEARTPLIISASETSDLYTRINIRCGANEKRMGLVITQWTRKRQAC